MPNLKPQRVFAIGVVYIWNQKLRDTVGAQTLTTYKRIHKFDEGEQFYDYLKKKLMYSIVVVPVNVVISIF